MSTVSSQSANAISPLIAAVTNSLEHFGELTQFSGRALAWMVRRRPVAGTMLPIFYNIGVRSISVVAITGMFIGMVLAVQSYVNFHDIGMATRLGAIVNTS